MPLQSPTLSAASASSYDFLSDTTLSSTALRSSVYFSDSEEEIVYSVSNNADLSDDDASQPASVDHDFVIISTPPSPEPLPTSGLSTPVEDISSDDQRPSTSLTLGVAANALAAQRTTTKKKPKKKKSKKAKPAASTSLQAPTVKGNGTKKTAPHSQSDSEKSVMKRAKPARKTTPVPSASTTNEMVTGLGSRPIVDDLSDRLSVISDDNESVAPTKYEEAAHFISLFLSNPEARTNTICRLTLLQSLIVELGLGSVSSLPASLTAARAFLKQHAFLNIREYIATRNQGPEAVQRLIHPSKSALIRDIKRKRNPASLKWVKEHGLQVLLVGWMY
ncbi:hypothetical protein CVT24_010403 [Panaeolus cyanescens]|uniref:Uncharacterized protein n=1 Tax=Panaeolus cyanescens TaxID=181874 RepID=A0A409YPL4_9AGAR|nr:hypothetical protein CVT24_010403 [Panaeolus cyanescens]